MAVKVCPVCGAKVKCKIKVANGGVICSLCSQLSPNYAVETVEALKEYYKTQTHRRSIFAKTRELKSVFSDTIVIDESNKLFYIYKKNYLPIIYQFDEVNGCEYIEIPPTQTISKKKGGLRKGCCRRCVVRWGWRCRRCLYR